MYELDRLDKLSKQKYIRMQNQKINRIKNLIIFLIAFDLLISAPYA